MLPYLSLKEYLLNTPPLLWHLGLFFPRFPGMVALCVRWTQAVKPVALIGSLVEFRHHGTDSMADRSVRRHLPTNVRTVFRSEDVDGNVDGIGDNANIIQIAALEKKKVFGGEEGFSISEKYDVVITTIGTFAQRAGVTKEALTVVYDENVAKRDQVAGVSLDQEAADLVRYQQAYQASAKVMQTASVLFDAIIAIR